MSENLFLQVGVPLGLFVIMFGLGTTLSRHELRAALAHRKALAAGLLAQLLLLPAVGMFLAWLAPVSLEFKMGILILACCPGGTTSNIFAHLARGNLALSVSLTTLSSLASLVIMPIALAVGVLLLAGEGLLVEVPHIQIIKGLLALTVIPVSLGMLLRHLKPHLALALEHRIAQFSSGFLAVLIVVITIKEWDVLQMHISLLAPLLIGMSALTMLAGVAAGRAIKADHSDTVTIGLEAGIQNSGLAIFIALSVLGNDLMAIPAAIYSLCMYLSGGFLVWWGRRRTPLAAAV